jgi:hypothetical protein
LPVAGLLGVVGTFAACTDNNDLVVGPVVTGTVVTFKDSTFDFTTLHTFSMPDTVVHLSTGTLLDVNRAFDATILSQVRSNFLSRGYVEISDPRSVKPDFVVLVATTATTNFNAFSGSPFFTIWGFSGVFSFFTFDSSWTEVFPWFPVVGNTAFDRGTLIVDLIPTSSVNTTNRTIRSAWAGVATALLNGTITGDVITSAINQMFIQSPYLTATTVTVH